MDFYISQSVKSFWFQKIFLPLFSDSPYAPTDKTFRTTQAPTPTPSLFFAVVFKSLPTTKWAPSVSVLQLNHTLLNFDFFELRNLHITSKLM